MRKPLLIAAGIIVAAIILPDRSPSTDPIPVEVPEPPRAERELVADETSRDEILTAGASNRVSELPAPPARELTTEQKQAAVDRMNAAAERVAGALSDIGRMCAQPAGRVEAVAYAKCVGRILERICPDIGEGALNDMSDAARDMDAPESASLLANASLDCWTAVSWANTPSGGTFAQYVGDALTEMGEKMAEASAKLR